MKQKKENQTFEKLAKFLEPATWIADEDLWDRAKKAVSKTYKKSDPAFYPVVVYVYKKMGGTIKKQKKEATNSSEFPQVLREAHTIKGELREASGSVGSKFEAILIQEGLGSLATAFYYSKDCLKNSYQVFEGKKIYADHPTSIEEQTRPERSVRDILGYFENVRYQENDGRGAIVADLVLVDSDHTGWAKSLVMEALEYAKKYPNRNFVGLSINADGEFEVADLDEILEKEKNQKIKEKLLKAKENGIENVKVVTRFVDAVSCDLVTEPGADGKILNLKEGDKKMKQDEMKHEDEQQDIELIKKLLKEYLGEESEECDIEAALEVYQAIKTDHKEKKEAIKHAAEAIKAAKKIAQKQKENKENEESEESEEAKHAKQSEESEESEENEEAGKHKESTIVRLQKEVAELKGKLAKLQEAKERMELEKLIDNKLAKVVEDKLKKEIKESALKIKEKNAALAMVEAFLKGYTSKTKEAAKIDFFTSVEKDFSISTEKKINLSDCLN